MRPSSFEEMMENDLQEKAALRFIDPRPIEQQKYETSMLFKAIYFDRLKSMVEEESNDMELGGQVRAYINSLKNKNNG